MNSNRRDIRCSSIDSLRHKARIFCTAEVNKTFSKTHRCKEQLINQMLSTVKEVPPKYIVLIEQPEQIAEIHTPNTSGYCTVSSGGDVQYYQIE